MDLSIKIQNPFVTVLLPVYNGGTYLSDAIQSILNQSYKDFELLIINDCSTDHSEDVIRTFNDPRIILLNNTVNLGQTKSLNVGLRLAKGKYIARMDADDLAFSTWLESLVGFIQKNPQYPLVSPNALVIDDNNHIMRTFDLYACWEDMLLRSITSSPVNHVGSIFDREAVIQEGGYDEDYRISADYHLWIRLIAKKYQFASVPKTLVAIRRHQQSLSLSQSERETEELSTIIQKHVTHLTRGKIPVEKLKNVCLAFYNTGKLNDQEFAQAMDTIEEIYANLVPPFPIHKETLLNWSKRQRKTLYIKRVFYHIYQKKYDKIRDITLQFIQQRNLCSLSTGLYIGSLLGKICLSPLPKVYDFMLWLKTQKMIMKNRSLKAELKQLVSHNQTRQ